MPDVSVERTVMQTDTLVQRVRDRAASVYGCDLTIPAMRKVFEAMGDELAHAADVAETMEQEKLGAVLDGVAILLKMAAAQ